MKQPTKLFAELFQPTILKFDWLQRIPGTYLGRCHCGEDRRAPLADSMQQPKEEPSEEEHKEGLTQPPPLMDGSSEEYKFTIDAYPSLQYNAAREPSFPIPKAICISKALLKIGRIQPLDM